MIGHEHHPGALVKAGRGEGVEQSADGGVGDGDRAVEVGEVATDRVGVGQGVGHHDVRGVGGLVPVVRIGPVGFEETGRQQERTALLDGGALGEPLLGAVDDIVAVGVGHVEFVEAEPGGEGGLVLHTE